MSTVVTCATRIRGSRSVSGRMHPPFVPRLEHQNVPESILRVATSGQMILPRFADRARIQPSAVGESLRSEQILDPRTQRSAKPCADWDTETGRSEERRVGKECR